MILYYYISVIPWNGHTSTFKLAGKSVRWAYFTYFIDVQIEELFSLFKMRLLFIQKVGFGLELIILLFLKTA